nr:endonuclease/exonuclease/phosphatase family protein [Allomuricauda sp.]
MKKFIVLLVFTSTLFSAVGQELKVISYNIRYDNPNDGINSWDNRKENLCAQLKSLAPDVFGIQEGLSHQVKYMAETLDAYDHFGVGRDDGKEQGEYASIFYNRNKLEVLDKGTFWLSHTPDVPSTGWDAALPRICTFGKFKTKDNGLEFFVFNAHFDHVGKEARIKSAQLILQKIAAMNPGHLPVVFMGDLNIEPGHPGITAIQEKLHDSYVQVSNESDAQGTYNGFGSEFPAQRRIDYIFVSNDVVVIEGKILDERFQSRFFSDHFPVMAVIKIPN